jgi:hypothetical protein
VGAIPNRFDPCTLRQFKKLAFIKNKIYTSSKGLFRRKENENPTARNVPELTFSQATGELASAKTLLPNEEAIEAAGRSKNVVVVTYEGKFYAVARGDITNYSALTEESLKNALAQDRHAHDYTEAWNAFKEGEASPGQEAKIYAEAQVGGHGFQEI